MEGEDKGEIINIHPKQIIIRPFAPITPSSISTNGYFLFALQPGLPRLEELTKPEKGKLRNNSETDRFSTHTIHNILFMAQEVMHFCFCAKFCFS